MISEDTVTIQLEAKCSVKTLCLYVNYSYENRDTLKIFHEPPFKFLWNCSGVPSLDQSSFQLGYGIVSSSGDTIIAPPTPNRWMRLKSRFNSSSTMKIFETSRTDTVRIDGLSDEWDGSKFTTLGNGKFSVMWSPFFFYLFVSVDDTDITLEDRIEVKFDPENRKELFLGVRQRYFSFAPKGRRYVLAVDNRWETPEQNDSIVERVFDESSYKIIERKDGYYLEVKFPIAVLTSLSFPKKKCGFDLTVINGREITSWSGVTPEFRNSPSSWGELILVQSDPFLKILLLGGLFAFLITVVAFLIFFIRSKKLANEVELTQPTIYSKIIEITADSLSSPNFSIEDIAKELNLGIEPIHEEILKNGDYNDFEDLLLNIRINKAKRVLLNPRLTLEKSARLCGYENVKKFKEDFLSKYGYLPEVWIKMNEEDD